MKSQAGRRSSFPFAAKQINADKIKTISHIGISYDTMSYNPASGR